MNNNPIQNITIKNLWGEYNLQWNSLNPDVNILVGINGSGKSTILRILWAVLCKDDETLDKYGKDLFVAVEFKDGSSATRENDVVIIKGKSMPHSVLLSTFDTPILDKERLNKNESSLDQDLDFLIYQRGKEKPANFTNYRLKATIPKYTVQIADNVNRFFTEIINPLFEKTEKKIDINEFTNELIFRKKDTIIKLTDLSSGEKQMLILLFSLFLMENEPHIILMDEPEASLHIEWQQKLIDVMQAVNPNCQFIISTHSPSIFGKGWMDKVVHVEKLKA
jgi:predicted ATP-binding protein involved in virulence